MECHPLRGLRISDAWPGKSFKRVGLRTGCGIWQLDQTQGQAGMNFIQEYGYLGIVVVVGLESMGLPLPGEATLIAAALYAGKTQALNIWIIIACASAGAILGDNLGFWIGREIGFRLLLRYGGYIRLTENRIKLGRISVPALWREDCLLWTLYCGTPVVGCLIGWCQPNQLATLSPFQCCRRHLVGDIVWVGCLLPRTRGGDV